MEVSTDRYLLVVLEVSVHDVDDALLSARTVLRLLLLRHLPSVDIPAVVPVPAAVAPRARKAFDSMMTMMMTTFFKYKCRTSSNEPNKQTNKQPHETNFEMSTFRPL